MTGDYPPAAVDPEEIVAAEIVASARSHEASESFPRQAIERIRVATNWMSADQPIRGDLRHAALLFQRQAGVDLEPPMGSRGRGQAVVKQGVRRLIGWYVRFLAQQISALGQASARLGLAVSERTERLEAEAAADRAAIEVLAQRVADLEARLRDGSG